MDRTLVLNLEINSIVIRSTSMSWIPTCKNLKGIKFMQVLYLY